MTPDALAETLLVARASRRKITLAAHQRPIDWHAARRSADLACRGEPKAWKLGGTTQPVRDIFAIDAPFYGPLGAHELYASGEPVMIPPLPGPVAEPEIAVRLAANVSPKAAPRSDAEIASLIDAISPALDIAAVALENPAKEGVLSLIADRAGAGLILTGDWQPASDLPCLVNQPVRLLLDGRQRSQGNVNTLIGGVIGALRDFFTEAAREDRVLNSGDIIATGGLAAAIALTNAKTVAAAFDDWQTTSFTLEHTA